MTDATPDLLRLHRAIRILLAERMERGPTEQLDRTLMALKAELERLERGGKFS